MELPIFHPICTHLCRCAMRPHFHTFVCVTIAQVRNLFGPLVRNGPKFFLYFWQFSLKKWSKWHRWLILQDKNFWNKIFWSALCAQDAPIKKMLWLRTNIWEKMLPRNMTLWCIRSPWKDTYNWGGAAVVVWDKCSDRGEGRNGTWWMANCVMVLGGPTFFQKN